MAAQIYWSCTFSFKNENLGMNETEERATAFGEEAAAVAAAAGGWGGVASYESSINTTRQLIF